MEVKVINKSNFQLPEYKTAEAAGMDLQANISESILLKPLERILIPTGLYIQLPQGTEAQIRPRSGLAYNSGITVLNSPGTIDADYRGEIKILLVNLSNQDVEILPGDRIAQMIITNYLKINWTITEVLQQSERGAGGYGHTGK